MKISKFFKTVDDIVLYQGSLDELNRQEEINQSGKIYDFMPMKGSIRYLTGVIIPKPEEMEQILVVNLSRVKPKLSKTEIDEVAKYLFGIGKETTYESPMVQKFDLRIAAKKFGANGLIRLQKDNSENKLGLRDSKYSGLTLVTYWGTPVKLINY